MKKDLKLIIVGDTHAFSIDPEYGGKFDYKNGRFDLNKKRLEQYVKACALGGANTIRVLAECPFYNIPKSQVLTRFQYDKKKRKWDLTKMNQNYFDGLLEFFKIVRHYNMKLIYCFYDHVQHRPFSKHDKTSPWRKWNNIHKVENYQQNAIKIVKEDKIRYINIVRKVIKKTVNTLGTEGVIYSLGNEIAPIDGVNPSNWMYSIYKVLCEEGVDAHNISYGANGFPSKYIVKNGRDDFEEIKSPQKNFFHSLKFEFVRAWSGFSANVLMNPNPEQEKVLINVKRKHRDRILREMHHMMEFGEYQYQLHEGNVLGKDCYYMYLKWTGFPNCGIYSDDGNLDEENEGDSWSEPGSSRVVRRPGPKQWQEGSSIVFRHITCVGVETLVLNRKKYPYMTEIFSAISKGYKNVFGKFPYNYKREIPPYGEEIIEDEKPEEEEVIDEQPIEDEKPVDEKPKEENNEEQQEEPKNDSFISIIGNFFKSIWDYLKKIFKF